MKKYIGTGLMVFGLLFSVSFAVPAFAQTTDVAAQIAVLLVRIKALQTQIAQLQGQSVGTSACISLSYNLYADQTDATTNGDVSKLQQFLAQDSSIYPSGLVTGYFGPMTETAVQRWQATHSVVSSGSADTTGYGYVGPKTRAAMRCISSTNASVTFSASPTYGAAPLSVSFLASNIEKTAMYSIDFGDGSSGQMSFNAVCLECNNGAGSGYSASASHTYSAAGSYSATLYLLTDPCHGTPGCYAPIGRTSVGTATITVTGTVTNQSPSFTAVPISGQAPLAVTFTAAYLNKDIISQGGYSVNFGDGSSGQLTYNAVCLECTGIAGSYNASGSHIYTSAGTYRAQLIKSSPGGCGAITNPQCLGAPASREIIGSLTIMVTNTLTTVVPNTTGTAEGGGSYTMPMGIHSVGVNFSSSQTSVAGSAPLDVTFWSSSFQLDSTYSVDFGDGQSGAIQPGGCGPTSTSACSSPQVNHKYNSVGTYIATLYAISDPCGGKSGCYAPITRTVVSTAKIIVGS